MKSLFELINFIEHILYQFVKFDDDHQNIGLRCHKNPVTMTLFEENTLYTLKGRNIRCSYIDPFDLLLDLKKGRPMTRFSGPAVEHQVHQGLPGLHVRHGLEVGQGLSVTNALHFYPVFGGGW